MFKPIYIHKNNNISLMIPFTNIKNQKIYHIQNTNLYELYKIKEKYNKEYFNIMNHTYCILFDREIKTSKFYINNSFRPYYRIPENKNKFFEVIIKNKETPIYLQSTAKVFNENMEKMNIFDTSFILGNRKILGISYNKPKFYTIEKINIKEPEITHELDMPFLEITIDEEKKPIIIDNIVVEL